MSYTWSFLSYKQYVNCLKQYQEVKVLKRFFTKQTQEMLYGNEVHKALENYTKDGTHDCMSMSIQKTCRAVEAKLKEKNA